MLNFLAKQVILCSVISQTKWSDNYGQKAGVMLPHLFFFICYDWCVCVCVFHADDGHLTVLGLEMKIGTIGGWTTPHMQET